jgi:hypothetical protein
MARRSLRSILSILTLEVLFFGASASLAESRPACAAALVPPAIAIVNPYSAGARLASAFQKRGIDVYSLLAGGEPCELLKKTHRPDDFREERAVPEGAAPADVVAWLRERRVAHVLAGAEGSVATADALSEALGLSTSNGTALSEPRGNKLAMAKRFAEAGLRTIPTVATSHLETHGVKEAREWLRNGPVVVKPVHSAGTEDVYLCKDIAAIEQAIARIVGKVNVIGLRNREAVLQPFVHGTEYNIDVVVSNGVPRLAWIWRYHLTPSPTSAHVVDYVDLVDPESDEAKRIGDILFRAAEALGIRWGPLHLELFVDSEGPILLEAGARIGGGLGPLTAAATDVDVWELVAEAYLSPDEFARNAHRAYRKFKHARYVALSNFAPNRVMYRPDASIEDSPERLLRTLPSFHGVSFLRPHGAPVPITGSIPTALGFLELLAEDPATLDRDLAQLRRWEAAPQGFLTREAPVPTALTGDPPSATAPHLVGSVEASPMTP